MSLASWRDTPSRAAIVEFTEEAAQEVAPEERIAVFDNDGDRDRERLSDGLAHLWRSSRTRRT
jgi:ADP-ribose pyrophosphatase YjhB (NUDIX family)